MKPFPLWSELEPGDLLLGDDKAADDCFAYRDFVVLKPFYSYDIPREPSAGGVVFLDLHRGKLYHLTTHSTSARHSHTLVKRGER